jgi:hypothetical protein
LDYRETFNCSLRQFIESVILEAKTINWPKTPSLYINNFSERKLTDNQLKLTEENKEEYGYMMYLNFSVYGAKRKI